jgi:nicotinamide phosphoribosyltransferase
VENDGTVTEDELMNLADVEYVKHLITEVYPEGIVSIVADSFDYWNTITNTARVLKDVIMARNGKVVFRPDTGDPVKVVCGYDYETIEDENEIVTSSAVKLGDKYYKTYEVFSYGDSLGDKVDLDQPLTPFEIKGSIECLWDIFGGTTTPQGYKVLDPHVGLIYGDSITLDRARDISWRLKTKGFASINIVYGIGSYTYQHVTRDTDQYAVKATFARVNDKDINIFKKPKTGDGMKNSATGLVAVFKDEAGKLYLKDRATWEEVEKSELKEVFRDGKLLVDQTLSEIRARVNEAVQKSLL